MENKLQNLTWLERMHYPSIYATESESIDYNYSSLANDSNLLDQLTSRNYVNLKKIIAP